MKEELLAKFGEKLLQYAQNTETFLVNETPEYIKQLLEYAVIENVVGIIAILTITLFCLGCLIIAFKMKGSENRDFRGFGDGLQVMSSICSGIMVIICAISIPCMSLNIYKIKYTPKVYIVDRIQQMIKGGNCGNN